MCFLRSEGQVNLNCVKLLPIQHFAKLSLFTEANFLLRKKKRIKLVLIFVSIFSEAVPVDAKATELKFWTKNDRRVRTACVTG